MWFHHYHHQGQSEESLMNKNLCMVRGQYDKNMWLYFQQSSNSKTALQTTNHTSCCNPKRDAALVYGWS